jgi:hypothetical protein
LQHHGAIITSPQQLHNRMIPTTTHTDTHTSTLHPCPPSPSLHRVNKRKKELLVLVV